MIVKMSFITNNVYAINLVIAVYLPIMIHVSVCFIVTATSSTNSFS